MSSAFSTPVILTDGDVGPRDLRREALRLAATVRSDLREVEEELEVADIDHLPGPRTFD